MKYNKVNHIKVLEEIVYFKSKFGHYPTKKNLSEILKIGMKQLENRLNYLSLKGEIRLIPNKYRGFRLKHDE